MTRTRLTFAKISEALLAGKEVRYFLLDGEEGICSPIKLKNGLATDEAGDITSGMLFGSDTTHEIVEPKVTVWLNVYTNGFVDKFSSKKEADDWAGNRRIRCVRVEV